MAIYYIPFLHLAKRELKRRRVKAEQSVDPDCIYTFQKLTTVQFLPCAYFNIAGMFFKHLTAVLLQNKHYASVTKLSFKKISVQAERFEVL